MQRRVGGDRADHLQRVFVGDGGAKARAGRAGFAHAASVERPSLADAARLPEWLPWNGPERVEPSRRPRSERQNPADSTRTMRNPSADSDCQGRTMRIGDRACPWNGPGIAGCELRIGGRRSCCPRENGEVALRRRGVVARSRICDASCLDDFAGCRNHLLLAPRRRRVRTRQRSAAQPRAKRVRPRRLTDYWQGSTDVPESIAISKDDLAGRENLQRYVLARADATTDGRRRERRCVRIGRQRRRIAGLQCARQERTGDRERGRHVRRAVRQGLTRRRREQEREIDADGIDPTT